jgi:uncharacterized coiled-coil protein SlyX
MHKLRIGQGYLLAIVMVLSASLTPAFCQTAAPADASPAASTRSADEVSVLKQQLAAQQKQIEQMQAAMTEMRKRLDQVGSASQATQSASSGPAVPRSLGQVASTTPVIPLAPKTEDKTASTVGELKTGSETRGTTFSNFAEGQAGSAEEGPASIRYKGITITPGGFVAAETVTRQRATSSDINTPFNSIPYPGNALSKVGESNFTARQSRLSLLGESKIGSVKLTGYWEADWLGTGVTSNNRQSNSYVFRNRVLYGQAALDNGWSFTGGQQWSLLTENRKGIQNRQEVLPMTIDSQYHVGFSWERQYGFRVVKDFGGKFALGAAIEGPQATVGGRGFSSVTTTTIGSASVSTVGNNFLLAPGSGGGLYNFVDTTGYSVNKGPDFIIKAAVDPKWGHFELFGVLSVIRNRVYPCGVVGTNANDTAPPAVPTTVPCPVDGSTTPSAAGAFNDSRTGGGGGANLRLPLFKKKLDFALQGLAGDGVGRYGSAQLPDLTFRPDGTEALIRTVHGLAGLEYHPNSKLDIYGYFGTEYADRAAYVGYTSISVSKTPAIPAMLTPLAIPATTTTTIKLNQIGGYGSPFANNTGCSTEHPPANQLTPSGGGTCAGDTRAISEATLGFWHKIYQGSKGGLRWGIQYSYFTKSGWSGNNNVPTAVGVSPKAVDNMIWTSFRYYIP